MTRIRVKTAITCEYIALGANGKHTLVNTYAGDIIVAEMPANLLIAFYLEIEALSGRKQDIRFDILQDKRTIANANAQIPPSEEIGVSAVMVLSQLVVSFTDDGHLSLTAEGPGLERATIITKKVFKGIMPV